MQIGDLRIKLDIDPVTHEQRVPPEVMKLLTEFAAHRGLCEQCERTFVLKRGRYCATGQGLLQQIIEHPLVEFIPKK